MTSVLILAAEEAVDLNPFKPEFGLYVWTLLAFAIVFFVLARKVFPQLQETLSDRERKIKGDLEEAEKTKQEAEKVMEDYKAKIAEAREESNRIIEEARQSAEGLRKDLAGKAESDARETVAKAQEQLNAERDRAIGDLKAQLAKWSSEIASQIIQRELNAESHSKLIDSFIKDIQKA